MNFECLSLYYIPGEQREEHKGGKRLGGCVFLENVYR